jgi:hypothetical protein
MAFGRYNFAMRKKLLIVGGALAVQFNASALLIDFNDLSIGSDPNGVYGGQVRLTATGQTRDRETDEMRTATSGEISNLYGDSPNVLVRLPSGSGNLVTLAAEFLAPTLGFSFDINSNYSLRLRYTGIDALGAALSGSVMIFNTHDLALNHFSLTAAPGTYLTGFSMSQADDGSVEIAMDNLDFTTATDTTGVRVPDSGWTLGMAGCAMLSLFGLRRIVAA